MPAANGAGKPHRLSWRANGDNLDVALVVNRVLAAGGRAWRLRADDAPFEAGDYLLELTARQHAAIARLGLVAVPRAESLPAAAAASRGPRRVAVRRHRVALSLLRLLLAVPVAIGHGIPAVRWRVACRVVRSTVRIC